MARSKGLDVVSSLAASKEKDAARQLGVAHEAVAAQERQLQELQVYRDEYREKFNTANHSGVGVAALQEYRVFMAKLDQAIVQVQENIIQLQKQSEYRRQGWLEQRGKVKAIDRVVERQNRVLQEKEKRREQHDTDECGQRRGR